MRVIESIAELRRARAEWASTVGAVYTMGALHAGHLSLLEQARADNDAVIGTIFVNPAQFAADEDLAAYPRSLERDLALMDAAGVDMVFAPRANNMYPTGFQTTVNVGDVSQGLEGAERPGHFRGVATVVAKLFNITQPSTAYFGQKDAQQVVVLRRMVVDLNFPLQIVVCPTVREPDGLALSSRNAYLTPGERQAAPVLYRALQAAAAVYEAGERDPAALRETARAMLMEEPLVHVDYVAVNFPDSMQGVLLPSTGPILVSLAAQTGGTRLLDNMLLPAALNTRSGLTATLGQWIE